MQRTLRGKLKINSVFHVTHVIISNNFIIGVKDMKKIKQRHKYNRSVLYTIVMYIVTIIASGYVIIFVFSFHLLSKM